MLPNRHRVKYKKGVNRGSSSKLQVLPETPDEKKTTGEVKFEATHRRGSRIGEGEYGTVYKGVSLSNGKPDIAIKKSSKPQILFDAKISNKDIAKYINDWKKAIIFEAECNRIVHGMGEVSIEDDTIFIEPYCYDETSYEAQAKKVTSHPIITIVIKLLEGKPLDPETVKSPIEFIEICIAALEALEKVHSAKIIHLDIHKKNILFHKNNGRIIANIVDFGLARREGEVFSLKIFQVKKQVEHQPPEYQRHTHFKANKKHDIWRLAHFLNSALESIDCSAFNAEDDAKINDILKKMQAPFKSRISTEAALLEFRKLHKEIMEEYEEHFKQKRSACEKSLQEDGNAWHLGAFFKYIENNFIIFKNLPLDFKKECFQFLFSNAIKLLESREFTPTAFDQWLHCQACIFSLNTDFNEVAFLNKMKKLYNKWNTPDGLILLTENALKNNQTFIQFLETLSPIKRILLIKHLATHSYNYLVKLIANKDEFNNFYKLIPKDYQKKFLKLHLKSKQKLIEESLESKEQSQLPYLPLDVKRKASIDRWCFCATLLQDLNNLGHEDIETLHLPEWKEEYGLDRLRKMDAVDLSTLLEQAPYNIRLDIIKLAGADRLEAVIEDLADLASLLDELSPANHNEFLNFITHDFIRNCPYCSMKPDEFNRFVNHIDRIDRTLANDIIKKMVDGIIKSKKSNTKEAAKDLDKYRQHYPELYKRMLYASQEFFHERLNTTGCGCLPSCSMFNRTKKYASNRLVGAVKDSGLHDLSRFEKFALTSDKFEKPFAERLLGLASRPPR